MVDVRRHAPVGRYRAPRLQRRAAQGLEHVRQGRGRHKGADLYERDRAWETGGSAFRWILSTLIAAFISLMVTAVVVYGSLDSKDKGPLDLMAQLDTEFLIGDTPQSPNRASAIDWLSPKQDRLQLATTTLVARHIIHEQVRVMRNNRPFLQIKPYLRIRARLAPATRDFSDLIPAFNPVRLYSPSKRRSLSANRDDSPGFGTIATRTVELTDWTLPAEDRQELQPFEVAKIVSEVIEDDPGAPAVKLGIEQQLIDGLTPGYLTGSPLAPDSAARSSENVTILRRTEDGPGASGTEVTDDRDIQIVSPRDGETLGKLLVRIGTDGELAQRINTAAKRILGSTRLRAGQQVLIVIAGGASNTDVTPVKLSVFDVGQVHRVSVRVTMNGRVDASRQPDQGALIAAMNQASGETDRSAQLYQSIYALGLGQRLSPAQIMEILKIHAPDTDYRSEIKPGDTLEGFYELAPDERGDLKPTTLVYTSLTTNGTTRQYWRYRSQDGTIDYFDADGQNNRKFLLRKPVRGNNVRFTSGFGPRRHPILKTYKMHNGIDWAAPTGTPVVAAGNGVVIQAQYLRFNGNFVKIRHANGYQTSYSHLHRIADGIAKGTRVRQGQVIGSIGTTGRSTGPHLHLEFKINGRVVDPLKIPVPRERVLNGPEKADFNKERTHILSVMRSPPVRVAER